MPAYLFDASALLKRYFTFERGAETVARLFADLESSRYLLNISILEVFNAIYREQHHGNMSADDARRLIAALNNDFDSDRLLVLRVEDEHVRATEPVIEALQARSIIKKRPGPLDALLITCALELELDDIVLVSSDRDLNELAKHFGIETLDPESQTT